MDLVEKCAAAIWKNHRVEEADTPHYPWSDYVSAEHRPAYISAARL